MKEIEALRKERGGLCTPITIFASPVGLHANPMDAAYETRPLVPTGETERLRGWNQLDGWADVYETSAGIEILVPRHEAEITNLDELCEAMRNGDPRCLDRDGQWVDSLPTFGGEEPTDTLEVWSWDASRLLVGTCADDLKIVDR